MSTPPAWTQQAWTHQGWAQRLLGPAERQVRPRPWLGALAAAAGALLLATAGQLDRPVLVGAVFVVQIGLTLAWLGLVGAPGTRGALLLCAGVAAAGDVAVSRDDRPAAALAAVVAMALIGALFHQVVRGNRRRVVTSMAAELSAALVVVCLACLVGLSETPDGRRVLMIWAVAVGAGLVAGRLVDHVVPVRGLQHVPNRGLLGVLACLAVSTGASLLVVHGSALHLRDALWIGLASAVTAQATDLAIDQAATDVLLTDEPRLVALRPLAALLPLALAAPAAYIASRILLG